MYFNLQHLDAVVLQTSTNPKCNPIDSVVRQNSWSTAKYAVLVDSSYIPVVYHFLLFLIGSVKQHLVYSRARGRGFETYLRRVVSLSKTLYSPKVLVIPRKRRLRLDMTVHLLTWTLGLNTNKIKGILFEPFCSAQTSYFI